MRLVDEFRNPEAAKRLAAEIGDAAVQAGRRLRLMEVCGGHTMAIHRFGVPGLLPDDVELLSGPGCPVCVTPTTYLDLAVELGQQPDTTLATFGDLYRVPGTKGSLEEAAARGADVRVVYSARDALKIAESRPDRNVVFLAIGFETTAPGTAATVLEAQAAGLRNFRVLSGHKTMPQALRALVSAPEVALDGFILPGHVSTITGPEPYDFLAREHGMACCVTGFEPTDILRGILALVRQVAEGKPRVENQYRRAVRSGGNPRAREVVDEVFEAADSQWRGLGMIKDSGLALSTRWSDLSVEPPDPATPSAEHGACRCAEVLRGLVRPTDCPLFGTRCVPDSPIGPCMVSSEGACAALYKYGTG
ncbi:MAG: hydrogenase formation protein HypD [Planctomycetota bacterium]|jgi:hydrogenase expression/formation protein HypD